MKPVRVGVFDSGVGGQSVANALTASIDEIEIVLREDKKNLPYGTKSPEELLSLVTPILKDMENDACTAIVVACNTVSTTIIDKLRHEVGVPLIAVEPQLNTAASVTKSSIITVCATPATLASARYKFLKSETPISCSYHEPDCSTWAKLIEDSAINRDEIEKIILTALDMGSDAIVLGCTHYHWIEELISDIVGNKAVIIQPEERIIAEVRQLISQLQP